MDKTTPENILLEELVKQFENHGIADAGKNAERLKEMVVRVLGDSKENVNAFGGYSPQQLSAIASLCTLSKDVMEFSLRLRKNKDEQRAVDRGIAIHSMLNGAFVELGRRLSQQVEVKSIHGPKAALPSTRAFRHRN
ncbi:MAG: hypothetical protein QW568_05045 [Candidatus Anstonellaceae archaeon]